MIQFQNQDTQKLSEILPLFLLENALKVIRIWHEYCMNFISETIIVYE